MELEESQIINLAVNIFQNVGIKRYIGDIEALKHEDIYFEIYKIIFPDSMINIFKISESSLTTGQKIQKIIQEISSIIRLDLYHISGEAIAQGNINHITNWLQLLEALSNNFIGHTYHGGGGSAPDLDQYIEKEFEDDCYHTVIGCGGEFDNPGYDDHRSDSNTNSNSNTNETIDYASQDPTDQESQQSGDRSSHNSEVLKPVEPTKKFRNQKKPEKKKVTFNLEKGNPGPKRGLDGEKDNIKYSGGARSTGGTSLQGSGFAKKHKNPKKNTNISQKLSMYSKSSGPSSYGPSQIKKQKKYLSKMYEVMEELEKKTIYDNNMEFQNWAFTASQMFKYDKMRIEAENRERINFINTRIVEREQLLDTIAGEDQAVAKMKEILREQRRNEKLIRKFQQSQDADELNELMEPNFAEGLHNRILEAFAE